MSRRPASPPFARPTRTRSGGPPPTGAAAPADSGVDGLRGAWEDRAAEAWETKPGSVARCDADIRTRRAQWAYEDATRAIGAATGVPESIGDRMRRLGERSATMMRELELHRRRRQRLADEAEFERELGE
jgi:hypothetical protein